MHRDGRSRGVVERVTESPRAMSSRISRRGGVSPGQTGSDSVMSGLMSYIFAYVPSYPKAGRRESP